MRGERALVQIDCESVYACTLNLDLSVFQIENLHS